MKKKNMGVNEINIKGKFFYRPDGKLGRIVGLIVDKNYAYVLLEIFDNEATRVTHQEICDVRDEGYRFYNTLGELRLAEKKSS